MSMRENENENSQRQKIFHERQENMTYVTLCKYDDPPPPSWDWLYKCAARENGCQFENDFPHFRDRINRLRLVALRLNVSSVVDAVFEMLCQWPSPGAARRRKRQKGLHTLLIPFTSHTRKAKPPHRWLFVQKEKYKKERKARPRWGTEMRVPLGPPSHPR